MSETIAGERLYLDGLSKCESSSAMAATYNNLSSKDAEQLFEKERELQQEAVRLFERALTAGLDAKTEIQCRLRLGVALFDMDYSSYDFVSNSGLDNFQELKEAVTQLETALDLDAGRGTRVFTDRISQSNALLRLDTIWQRQSLYLKNEFGTDRKLSYLQEKLALLDYLGVKPPGLCLSLAFYYKDLRNRELTLEWLKHAAAADDYGDLDDKSFYGHLDTEKFLHDVASDNKQRAQKGVREMSASKVSPQKRVTEKSAEKKTGGCFIATAVYGSATAPEVMILRRFRDDVLIESLPGRIGITLYYRLSPPLASFIAKRSFLRLITDAVLLRPIVFCLKPWDSRRKRPVR